MADEYPDIQGSDTFHQRALSEPKEFKHRAREGSLTVFESYAMRPSRVAWLAGAVAGTLVLGLPRAGAAEGNCSAIDPTGVLAGITGDWQTSPDPDDPQGHVIFESNTTGNVLATQNVVVAQIDGVTGMVVPGTLTVIADNFYGNSYINGPEWFRSPQGNLAVAYPGVDGIYMAFRAEPPQSWSAFSYDYTGAPTNGSPPPLPNTLPGTYITPPPRPPAEEAIYSSFGGDCNSLCYANYQGGPVTDVSRVLGPQGYTAKFAAVAAWDGYIYYSACKTTGGGCGLFIAALDGQGGLSGQTLLVSTGNQTLPQIAAYRHPVTGTPVVFTPASPTTITVWTHAAPTAPLVQLATVPAALGQSHYRVAASTTQVVLNFFVQNPGPNFTLGSYTIAVSAVNGVLSAAPANLISPYSSGSELTWYQAAGKWRIVYRRKSDNYVGCWVTP